MPFRWVELLTVLAFAKLHAVVLAQLVCPGIDIKPRCCSSGLLRLCLSE
jgi:hypothetical protein